jgi:hypothetical protein
MNRRLRALVAAGALGLFAAAALGGVALAGGWASITPDEASVTIEPKEGEPAVLGFTVLQHGETPAPWEHPTVILTNAETGERLEVGADSTGEDGHFEATVTFPEAGLWSWQVGLRDLVVDPMRVPVAVMTADGRAPQLDVAAVFRIADEAAAQARNLFDQTYGETITTLQREVQVERANVAALQRLVAKQASADAAGGPGPSTATNAAQLVAVIVLAIIAGAGSALVTTLALRPRLGRAAVPAAPGYAPR